jgi:hypothetical protein
MSTAEEIEKEKLRKERMDQIAIGQTCPDGYRVYAVYTKTDDFAIYATSSLGTIKAIRWRIDAKDPDKDRELIKNHYAVTGAFDKLKAVANRCIDPSYVDPSYAGRAAAALSLAIGGDPKKAEEKLDEIGKNIENDYKERIIGKLLYLSGTLIVALVLCSIGLYLYLFQPEFFVKDRTPLYELILVCSLSTLGGIVSVSIKIDSINVDKGIGKSPFFIYGLNRNIFSVLGGVFMFVIIKSNLLFGFITTLDNSLYGFLVFGFLAGFSETLVPNALKRIEDKVNKESNKYHPLAARRSG